MCDHIIRSDSDQKYISGVGGHQRSAEQETWPDLLQFSEEFKVADCEVTQCSSYLILCMLHCYGVWRVPWQQRKKTNLF